jgi:hypothetical protein
MNVTPPPPPDDDTAKPDGLVAVRLGALAIVFCLGASTGQVIGHFLPSVGWKTWEVCWILMAAGAGLFTAGKLIMAIDRAIERGRRQR